MSFVHLHNYSEYSFSTGIMPIPQMVEQAKRLGMTALALTDTGNLIGAYEFYNACQQAEIKPVLGLTVNVKTSAFSQNRSTMQLVLLAENDIGWQNLIKISSECCSKGITTPIAIEQSFLSQFSDGIICLLPGIQATISSNYNSSKKFVMKLAELFGDKQLYLSVQNHGELESQKSIQEMVRLGKELHLPITATNQSLFTQKADLAAYQIVQSIIRKEGDLNCIDSISNLCEYYLKSPNEMINLFQAVPRASQNSVEIAERCNVTLKVDKPFAEVSIPAEFENSFDYLKSLCYDGLKSKIQNLPKAYTERIDQELNDIKSLGFEQYFIQVAMITDIASKSGIFHWDRGAASGSLVNYALGISVTDPIQYGLIYERFINNEREFWPDIDLDIISGCRSELLDKLGQAENKQQVTRIGSIYRISEEQAIKEVAAAKGYNIAEIQSIIYDYLANPDYEPTSVEEKVLYEAVNMLVNKPFRIGSHSCGFTLTSEAIDQIVPLIDLNDQTFQVTQFPMKDIEEIGLIKFDLIESKTLLLIEKTIQLINEQHGTNIDILNIPEHDTTTFEMLGTGKNAGIFQFGSSEAQKMLMDLKPENIDQLADMLAIYRPGIAYLLDDYITRKKGQSKIESIHPVYDRITEKTFGLLVYQEQIMRIGVEFAGLSLNEADLMRRALARKNVERIEYYRKQFLAGAKRIGIDEKSAEDMYNKLENLDYYAFNKSHAVSYARLAYRVAYLKAHFPKEFTTAFSNVYNSRRNVLSRVIEEAEASGVTILKPDINQSQIDSVISGDAILLGLANIQHCSSTLWQDTISEREANGAFCDMFDFVFRIPANRLNRNCLSALITEGAFNNLPGSLAQKFAAVNHALNNKVNDDILACKLPEQVDSINLIKEIIATHFCKIKDISFDIYCPKTYSHHLRFTMWMPPETVVYNLDALELIERARNFVGYLETERNENYAIGINSRVDQYSDKHLFMLDFDSIDQKAIDYLRQYGGYLLKSGRGYHFIGNKLFTDFEEWKSIMKETLQIPELRPHIDKAHIDMSLKRGYSTLRILESPLKPHRPMMAMVL